MPTKNKQIANIIKTQFPEFYHEEGPVFIDFVEAYYNWLESKTDRLKDWVKPNRSSVSIVHGQANVAGSNTEFLTNFSNGDKIAFSRGENDYEIFTIDTISNNTFLSITEDKLPKFASSNSTHGYVASEPNPNYYVRRTQDVVDIDTTTSEFLVWFKETYLKNIQFETVTDTRTLIKHSLDLYRSKGTPRSVDLLFKATYGVPAEVFYPQKDLFTTSSGNWHVSKYLELSPNKNSNLLVDKQISGLKSGAVAFCDAVVRKTVKGKFIDVAYISAINGDFETNEIVVPFDSSLLPEEAPIIVGSLNAATIASGGAGFSIGDKVDLYSNSGEQAQGRIANTVNATGAVGIVLEDGGYAYSSNTELIISNNILTLSNVQTNTANPLYFQNAERVTQPLANVTYTAATDTPTVGDFIYTYHANNDQKGFGQILEISAVNSTAGEFLTTIISGDLDHATYYTAANAGNLTRNVYTDKTASGNTIGYYANVTLYISNIVGEFVTGETVFQNSANAYGNAALIYNVSGATATMTVDVENDPLIGEIFNSTKALVGNTSGATANIDTIDIQIGIKDVTNDFITTANNYLTGNTSLGAVNATVSFVSSGSGMTFSIANTYDYEEYVNLNTDIISDYVVTTIDAAAYAFPGDASGNLTSNTITNMLAYANTKIGKIKTITGINPGENYNLLPIIRLRDKFTSGFGKPDSRSILISGLQSNFSIGEVVTQANSDFRGLVTSANSTAMEIESLRFDLEKDLVVTVSEDTKLVGADAAASANVISVSNTVMAPKHGNNATIGLSLTTSNGVATEIEILDSGLGFINGETIYWSNGSAIANTYTHGTARGFYKDKNGFVSNIKKLYDGEYWQYHSYEVRSSVDINKYETMLKQVVHVAGTALFGNLVYTSTADMELETLSSIVSTHFSNSAVQDSSDNAILDRDDNLLYKRD